MAKMQFWGTLEGRAGKVQRGGTKDSGLQVEAAGWQGRIRVHVWYDRDRERDMFAVDLVPHWDWGATGDAKRIAEGVLNHNIDDPFIPALIA